MSVPTRSRLLGGASVAVLLSLVLAACDGGGDRAATAVTSSAPVTVTVTATPTPEPTTEPPTWPGMFDDVSDGVARISAVLCDGRATGSGFLVSDDEVMTAAHVVADATSLSVRLGRDVHTAVVVGRDAAADLALLRLAEPATGHVFAVAATPARVGEDVAALGYPLGRPLAMTKGTVSAVGRTIEVEGRSLGDLLQTDAAINHGNSGGPVVTVGGEVVGVVSSGSDLQGDNYAVEQPALETAFDRWHGQPGASDDGASCAPAVADADGTQVDVHVSSDAPEAVEIAQIFQLYAQSINSGWYEQAWSLLSASARARQKGDYDGFASRLESSYWLRLDVESVTVVDDETDTAVVAFTTEQDAAQGPGGQTCSRWRLRYRLVLDEGDWQIDRASSLGTPRAC